jgi:hypothetical protein
MSGRGKIAASALLADDDGADVDVLLFNSEDGGFLELEFNRLDTLPLLMKTKLRGDQ